MCYAFSCDRGQATSMKSDSLLLRCLVISSAILLLMICPVESFLPMEVHVMVSLPESYINHRFFNVQNSCSCRTRCNVKPNCTAAMIYQQDGGVLDCYLSDVRPVFGYDLLPNMSAVTLLNNEPQQCIVPFNLVSDVGCVYVAWNMVVWDVARTECRKLNSDLYVGSTSQEHAVLWEYLVTEQNAGPSSQFWVGVKNRKWFDGREVTDWAPGQPTGNLALKPCQLFNANGKMSDTACDTIKTAFICKKRV